MNLSGFDYKAKTRLNNPFVNNLAFMMTLGDVISQQLIEKKGHNHDYARSLRMTAYGALIGGPVIGTWFGFINRAITIKNKWAGTVKKLIISWDKILTTPTYSNHCSSWY
jgi:protein Mpv17